MYWSKRWYPERKLLWCRYANSGFIVDVKYDLGLKEIIATKTKQVDPLIYEKGDMDDYTYNYNPNVIMRYHYKNPKDFMCKVLHSWVRNGCDDEYIERLLQDYTVDSDCFAESCLSDMEDRFKEYLCNS